MSASASIQVIIMCVHRQQPVCLCTFTTKVCLVCTPKTNVRTCLHSLPPLHVCICQSSTQALCIYSHVTYVHVSICALDPSTNACIHVNRQHNDLSTITCVHKCQHRLQPKSSSCVHIDNNLYVYAHLQQSLMSCPPKPNVHTCLHCLPPMHVCMSIVNTGPMRCRQQPEHLSPLHTCLYRLQPKSTSYVYIDKLVRMSTYMPALPSPLACVYTSIIKQALCNIDNNLNIRCHIIHRHVHTCQHHLPPQSTSCMYKSMHIYTTKSQSTKASMVKYVHVSICALQLMHLYKSIVNTMPCRQ